MHTALSRVPAVRSKRRHEETTTYRDEKWTASRPAISRGTSGPSEKEQVAPFSDEKRGRHGRTRVHGKKKIVPDRSGLSNACGRGWASSHDDPRRSNTRTNEERSTPLPRCTLVTAPAALSLQPPPFQGFRPSQPRASGLNAP